MVNLRRGIVILKLANGTWRLFASRILAYEDLIRTHIYDSIGAKRTLLKSFDICLMLEIRLIKNIEIQQLE